MSRDYGLRFEDILKNARLAIQFLGGLAPESAIHDPMRVAAIERCFTIIGEAAYKLPRLERGQFPQLSWAEMRGLRHHLVHGYDDINPSILIDTVIHHLPAVIAAIEPHLSKTSIFPSPIKICGLSTPETIAAALDAGADMVGLVFHPKSPRNVSLETASALSVMARGRALVAALVVDAADERLDAVMEKVSPDLWQLHGSETPERLDAITKRYERPVMKAVGVAAPDDLAVVKAYRPHTDRILLDAKPPKDAAYPGGHGKAFDWTILKGLDPFMPFMLSGGLTPENVGAAIATAKGLGVSLAGVDVSSGVESAPGVKDVSKIKTFIDRARDAISFSP